MTLGDLIKFLESQQQDLVVERGFSTPHSDRGDYSNVAFTPAENVTIASMLEHARSALEQSFFGYKGGSFTMSEFTPAFIGEWGVSGEPIEILLAHIANTRLAEVEAERDRLQRERDAWVYTVRELRTQLETARAALVEHFLERWLGKGESSETWCCEYCDSAEANEIDEIVHEDKCLFAVLEAIKDGS